MHDFTLNGAYESKEDWYEALVAIAKRHNNKFAVRDFDGWTDNWENQTPEESYYEDFPEHIETWIAPISGRGKGV